jgi:hypothetical protein
MEPTKRKMMPLWWSETQQEKMRIGHPCNSCLVYELHGNVLIPGAKCWSDIIDIDEFNMTMQLFLFIIDMCINAKLDIFLEILVSDFDYRDVNKETVSSYVKPMGYRLWIPIHDHSIADIEDAIATMVCKEKKGPEHATKKRKTHAARKKRYTDMVETHQQLEMLTRLYSKNTTSDLLKSLDVKSYFQDDTRRHINLIKEQQTIAGYMKMGSKGTNEFCVSEYLRKSGLVRWIEFPSTATSESIILEYFLPHHQPSEHQLYEKYKLSMSATGSKPAQLPSVKTMICAAINNRKYIISDPHNYSPIVQNEMEELLTGNFERVLNMFYYVTFSLKGRNQHNLDYNIKHKDTESIQQFFIDAKNEINTMLSVARIKGVPKIYSDLYKDQIRQFEFLHSDTLTDRMSPAQIIMKEIYTQIKEFDFERPYTRLSKALHILTIGARDNLWFLPQQQSAHLPIYLRHFSITRMDQQVSSQFILYGAPGVGKSDIITTTVDCISQPLIRRRDTQTAKVDCISDDSDDLTLKWEDESKMATKEKRNSEETKNEQTRMSTGYIVHTRTALNPDTGVWDRKVTTIGLNRNFKPSSTNFPNEVVLPIKSRTCMFCITEMPPEIKKYTRSINTSIIERAKEDNVIHCNAWQMFLRHVSVGQGYYSAAEAFGVFPSIDTTCLSVFQAILEFRLGKDTLPPRRTVDIKDMSDSIMRYDAIRTWQIDGLGARFKFKREIELAWYAWRRYLSMEHIIQAYTVLEQPRCIDNQINTIISTLKSNIAVVEDYPVDSGDYWVLRFKTESQLISALHSSSGILGEETCSEMFATIKRGSTAGQPNISHGAASIGQHQGDYYMLNKQFAAKVNCVSEEKIIQMFKRLSGDAALDYKTESRCVFKNTIRAILVENKPISEESKYSELAGLSSLQRKLALRLLQTRLGPKQEKYIELPDEIDTASYKDQPGSIPSILYTSKKKIKTQSILPIVIDKRLWDTQLKKKNIEQVIEDMLLVAGGYTNRYVFSGVPSHSAGTDQDYIIINNRKIEINITNPRKESGGLFRNRNCGLFNGKASRTLTEKSNIESEVKTRLRAKLALPQTVVDVFKEYDI